MKRFIRIMIVWTICFLGFNFMYRVGFKVADSNWFECLSENKTRAEIYVCGSKIKR